jgi:hypothetical protein
MTLRLTTYDVPIDAECDVCGTRLWSRARLETIAPGVAIFRGDAGLHCYCGPLPLTGVVSVDPARPAFVVKLPLADGTCECCGEPLGLHAANEHAGARR